MNNIDKNPDYKQLYQIVVEKFKKTYFFWNGPLDETYFTLRVYETAKDIINQLNQKVNSQLILVSAILHDIGKIKLNEEILKERRLDSLGKRTEWKKHLKLGVPIAKKILTELGHSQEFIEQVCFLIKNHSNKNCEKSIELKILQDADQLADYGNESIIRCFLHAGKFEQTTIDSIKWLEDHPIKNRHDKLNLEISKKISLKKINIHNNVLKELSHSIKSDLLN